MHHTLFFGFTIHGDSMYPLILSLHNVVRWVVVLVGLWAFVQFLQGWLGRRRFLPADARAATFYTIALDIQLLLGLVLYIFLSPVTSTMFSNFGASMKIEQIRYFGLEHALVMIIAVVLGHIGSARSKRGEDGARLRQGAIFFGISFLAIVLMTPWVQRPLWRWLQ